MITPVILAGGFGTRLWPVSRESYPKQFQHISGNASLLQQAVLRVQGTGFAAPLVITGEAFRFTVQDHFQAIDAPYAALLVEPEGRNTGPAVLAAALRLAQRDPEGVMLVLPSDHAIPDMAAFQDMVLAAKPAADAGQIVTFGVVPDRPDPGFGYLQLAQRPQGAPVPLAGFVEKPDEARAKRLMAQGHVLWNAGIFLMRADVIVAAYQSHAPDLIAPVTAALQGAKDDLGFTRLAAGPWAQARDVSVDVAVMEAADNLVAMLFAGAWSDLGSWEALWRHVPHSDDGVALAGDAHDIGSENSLLYCDQDGPAILGVGLKDTVVVSTKDAVLVADKTQAQNIKQAVQGLAALGQEIATQTPRVYRPWGWYETLTQGARFQVKRIVVKPGGILSLQSHQHRSEHWVVVEGQAKVTLDGTVQWVAENQSVYIPSGARHRMENPGKLPMVLIEVQTGAYLGEDDIVRFEDVYKRPFDE